MQVLDLKVTLHERTSNLNRSRAEGFIPCIIYKTGINALMKVRDWEDIVSKAGATHLSITKITLVYRDKEFIVICKDVGYNNIYTFVAHLDFMVVNESTLVKVNVPIKIINSSQCPGIKSGGNIYLIKKTLKIYAEVQNIPNEFVINVEDLNIKESKRIRDINGIGNKIKVLNAIEKDVVVLIDRR